MFGTNNSMKNSAIVNVTLTLVSIFLLIYYVLFLIEINLLNFSFALIIG